MIGRTLAAITLVIAIPATVLAQPRSEPIRGDVVKIEGAMLFVHATSGEDVAIRLADAVRVSVRAPASLDAIEPGAFVATTATPQADGTLRASELRIFAESMRGLGEGHRPMATQPGSTMTNATVASVGASGATMSNATVAGASGARNGRTLRLVYPGGEQTVFVPIGTPVARVEQGDAASLVPGAHVVVYPAAAAGAPTAERISVGKDGSVPPS